MTGEIILGVVLLLFAFGTFSLIMDCLSKPVEKDLIIHKTNYQKPTYEPSLIDEYDTVDDYLQD